MEIEVGNVKESNVCKHIVGGLYKYENEYWFVTEDDGCSCFMVNLETGEISGEYDSLEDMDNDNKEDVFVNSKLIVSE